MRSEHADAESVHHRSRLARTRTATVRRIANLTKTFDEIVEAAADVATDDEHDPEGHTIAWERQQIAGLIDEAKATLAALITAETRLDDGTYGVCGACNRRITADRLVALPAIETCVACAR